MFPSRSADVNTVIDGKECLLHNAVRSKDIKTLKMLLESGVDVNAVNMDKETPLHIAARSNDIESVVMLLKSDADVNAVNINNETPLHNAVRSKYINNVKMLLMFGADVNAVNMDNETALCIAFRSNAKEAFKWLLILGAVNMDNKTLFHNDFFPNDIETFEWIRSSKEFDRDISKEFDRDIEILLHLTKKEKNVEDEVNSYIIYKKLNALSIDECSGNKAIIKLLLDKGEDVNNVKDLDVKTILHEAVVGGNVNVVKLLLKYCDEVRDQINFQDNGSTPIYLAALSGCESIVKVLLDYGAEINCEGEKSTLLSAIYSGNEKIIKLLLNNGAKINAKDEQGRTILHIVIINDKYKDVKFLLGHIPGIAEQINFIDDYGRTPLYVAAEKGCEGLVGVLLDHKAKINCEGESPLRGAALSGNETIFTLLLKKGAVIPNDLDDDECTLLHNAVRGGNYNIVEDLLLNYSDEVKDQINIPDSDGSTPISLAALSGCESIVKVLLDNGAKINCEGKKSTLLSAIYSGNENIIKLLLDKETNVNAKDEQGRTILHIVINDKFKDAVNILLDYSREVRDQINFKDNNGKTPLYVAAEKGCEGLVGVLLDHKAKINYEGGKSPLWGAAFGGNKRIVMLLLDKGAVVPNGRDDDGCTLLHNAVRGGNEDIIKYLLENRDEVTAQIHHKYGRTLETPFDLAVRNERKSIVKVLLDFTYKVKDENERSLLHNAVINGNAQSVKLILEYAEENTEGDVDIEDKKGRTPLWYAVWNDCNDHDLRNDAPPYVNCIKLLLEYNADPHILIFDSTSFMNYVHAGNEIAIEISLDLIDINMIFKNKIEYPNYFLDCSENIKVIIDNHIIKLKVAGFYLNKHLQALRSINEAIPFHKECEEEVEKMKLKISDSSISVHDILVNRTGNSAYISNENIASVFESDEYKTTFPIYASMIERQYRKEVQRQKLLAETSHLFNTLTSDLPEVCVTKIKSEFTNCDLKKLKNAFLT